MAAYSFNETSGTVAGDASGNGRLGTVSGATWNPGGRFGGALSFDGSNDVVSIADANALDLTTGMTLSAWLRPSSLSGWRTAVMKQANAGLSYALYAHDDAPRPAAYINVGGADRSAPGAAALALNTWTHLATTYDGTTLRIFVNGAQVTTLAVTGSIATSTGALMIGGNTMWGEYFAGLIDEVRIYNRALSAAEIQSDMNAAVTPPGPDTTAPTVSLTAPVPGQVAGQVAITASATDNIGVTSVQFLLDSLSLGAADTAAPFTLTWDSTTVTNGTHTLAAIARDAAGNQTTSATLSVNVRNDLTAPTVSISAPAPGTVVGTVTVQANAADDIGVTNVQFLLNGANLGTADTAAPYSLSWNTLAHPNGAYVISAVAHDASGKQTTASGISITINNPPPPLDTTPPTVSLTAPAAETSPEPSLFRLNAADNLAVTSVQFQLNGANLELPTQSHHSQSPGIRRLQPTVHTR